MKSAICPKCFAQLTEEQWVYRCQNNGCRELDKNVTLSGAAKGRGDKAACPGCGENFQSPLCPECGFPIREDEQGSVTLSVSLVGAQGVGKSHYLSVLIEELRHKFSKIYDCALFPVGGDDTLSAYDREYYQPLYVNGKCLDSTEQDDLNPLLYSLVFQKTRGIKSAALAFYDACGANFESLCAMSSLNRSIYHSGGILFLLDPAQLPFIAEWQAARGVKSVESDAVSLLARTIHLVRTGNGQPSLQNTLDVPIAVCLTKLDTIETLLDASSFVRAPSRQMRKAEFDRPDFDACNLEVQSLIEVWGGGELIRQITAQFSNYAFFGLSALGGAPTDSGGIHHIAPHRVIDPLLWLLWKNNLIK